MGLASAFLSIGTCTFAFWPTGAGPWKCAIVTGPDKSAYVTVHCSVFVVVSKVAFSKPCPLLTRGGTSLDGCRLACNATLSANAEVDATDATDDINTQAKLIKPLR